MGTLRHEKDFMEGKVSIMSEHELFVMTGPWASRLSGWSQGSKPKTVSGTESSARPGVRARDIIRGRAVT